MTTLMAVTNHSFLWLFLGSKVSQFRRPTLMERGLDRSCNRILQNPDSLKLWIFHRTELKYILIEAAKD